MSRHWGTWKESQQLKTPWVVDRAISLLAPDLSDLNNKAITSVALTRVNDFNQSPLQSTLLITSIWQHIQAFQIEVTPWQFGPFVILDKNKIPSWTLSVHVYVNIYGRAHSCKDMNVSLYMSTVFIICTDVVFHLRHKCGGFGNKSPCYLWKFCVFVASLRNTFLCKPGFQTVI